MNVFQWLLLFVPLVLFLTVFGPLWLKMHYQHKSSLTSVDRQKLQQLLNSLNRFDERLATLESLIDHQDPSQRQE